jgi:protein tyrosine/serine phosphatase
MRIKASVKIWVAVICFLALTGFIIKNSVFRPAKNFHVVDEGKFYRMAQPTADELADLSKEYGIKTVINLRGKQEGEWWYDREAAASEKLGIKQIDIPFSSDDMQFAVDWKKYIETLESAERPILVHCRSGADRTSEASAVYAMEYMKASKEQAMKEQMALTDLHASFFQPAKKEFIRNYKGAEWLKTAYDPCAKEFRAFAGNRCTPEMLEEFEKKQVANAAH